MWLFCLSSPAFAAKFKRSIAAKKGAMNRAVEALASVLTLEQIADVAQDGNTTAIIFFLKTQAGWRAERG